MVAPTPELIDELFRDKVRQARRMTPEEKFLAGPRLFDYACRVARDGIRQQHPAASDERVTELLRQRIAIARHLECLE